MRKIAFPFLLVVLFVAALSGAGCDPYKKLAKSDKIADKDSAAVHYYNAKKYDRAVYLFEELMAIYRGTSRMEEMYYYYAYCRYFLGELVSASYYFEDFSKKFPGSKHSEEFEYMSAKSYHLLADPYYLDQKYTYKAIDQYQLFLSRHPYSDKKDKCMDGIRELRERLATKSFEQASLYHKIGYHKAAVEAFQIMVNEFPDSDMREEAQFLLFKSSVSLAEASINSKKLSRYEEAVDYYEKFDRKFPDSKFAKEAKGLLEDAEKTRDKLVVQKARADEEKLFRSFKKSIETVLNSDDSNVREKAYGRALDEYRDLKDRYPESTYLAEADKLFKAVEAKEDQN